MSAWNERDPGEPTSEGPAVQVGVSGAELLAALEFLALAVMVRRLDGTVVMVNSSFATMFGYSRDEVIGVNAEVFLSPERAFMVEESSDWLRSGQMRGFSGNGRMVCRDQSELRIRISVTTVIHNENMFVVSFIEDWSDILWSDPRSP